MPSTKALCVQQQAHCLNPKTLTQNLKPSPKSCILEHAGKHGTLTPKGPCLFKADDDSCYVAGGFVAGLSYEERVLGAPIRDIVVIYEL